MRANNALKQYAQIIRSRNYFPLWVGQLVSSFGDTLNYVALVVLVYRISGSGFAVSATVVFEILPLLLLAPIAGVVIDRFPRKAILIVSDLTRAALMLPLIFADAVWQVYAVAFLLTAGSVFFNPTLQAVIPSIVDRRALLAANSVAWSTNRLVQIMASLVVGALIATVGTDVAFSLNALSFIFSAGMILRVQIPQNVATNGRASDHGWRGWLRDAADGLRYVRQDLFVSRMLVLQALASLSVGATSALLVVLAERHLRLPPEGFAWLLGAIGFGALLGPLIFGSFTQHYHSARYLFIPYVIRGIGDILIALITPLPIALLILFVYGLNTSVGMVVYNSLMQSQVPERVRGRVFTLMDLTWSLMRLVSLSIGGVLVDAIGIQPVYYIGGALLVGAGVLGLVLLRGFTFANSAEDEPAAH